MKSNGLNRALSPVVYGDIVLCIKNKYTNTQIILSEKIELLYDKNDWLYSNWGYESNIGIAL